MEWRTLGLCEIPVADVVPMAEAKGVLSRCSAARNAGCQDVIGPELAEHKFQRWRDHCGVTVRGAASAPAHLRLEA